MLLIEKEISTYIDKMSDDETFDNWINDRPWKLVAKAQLKKVVEFFQMGHYSTKTGDGTYYVNIMIKEKDWQALLKECSEEN